MNQIFGQKFTIFEKWRHRTRLLLKLRPSKLLLHFIEYCLDQLKNKHTKTVVNSTMQFFESLHQRKYMVKIWSFLAHPPQNDGPVKFLQNWKATIFSWLILSNCANIRFGSLKMCNMSRIWIANNKWKSLWKSLVYDEQAIKNPIF